MNVKSLVAGVALFAGVGVANAAELLTEASMDGVTAAGVYDSVTFTKYVDTNVTSSLFQIKGVISGTAVYGQLADAEASASCYAYNCFTETLTATQTSYFGSAAYSQSISAQ